MDLAVLQRCGCKRSASLVYLDGLQELHDLCNSPNNVKWLNQEGCNAKTRNSNIILVGKLLKEQTDGRLRRVQRERKRQKSGKYVKV
jgi:hypothetical protein